MIEFKKIRFLVFLFSISLLSCKDSVINKEESKIITEVLDDEIEIIWANYVDLNDIRLSKEYYVYPSGDSVVNQVKRYKNSVLDTLKSSFYEFKDIKSNDGKNFKGSIEFHSYHDTIKKYKERAIEFSFLQENKDSVFYKTYHFKKDSNTLDFEYVNMKNQSIYGYIYEQILIDTIAKGEKIIRMIEQTTLIDNTNPTINPYNFKE